MPTYEYECRKCGHRFEKFQSITSEPWKKCPECEGEVRRIIGRGAAVIFKGSGFYATDYRSEEYKKKEKQEKAETNADKPKKDSTKVNGETKGSEKRA